MIRLRPTGFSDPRAPALLPEILAKRNYAKADLALGARDQKLFNFQFLDKISRLRVVALKKSAIRRHQVYRPATMRLLRPASKQPCKLLPLARRVEQSPENQQQLKC